MIADLWGRIQRGQGIWPAVPAFVFLLIFFVVPMGTLLSFGFLDIERGNVQGAEFTLKFLTSTLQDNLFWWVWWKSFYIGVLATLLCFLLAYPLAYLYAESGSTMRLIILTLTISPLLTSAIVRTYAWLVILGGRRGVINAGLLELGLIDRPVRMLNTDWAVIVGMAQVHLPFMVLPLMTALAGRDRNIEAASLGLGVGRLATFFKVTVPLSIPGIVAGLTIVFALSYTNFIIPQLLGGGGFTTLAVQVYEQIVVLLDWSKGAMLALLLLSSCFVFVLLIGVAGNRAMRWSEKEST